MSPPRATARLQLHRDWTFWDACKVVPYLARLGISHLYLSPILTARAGSMHGYDVVDHSRINPELGGEDAYRALIQEARRHDLGIVVDIVPNHMAVGEADNAWWLDVLEWGRASPFSDVFDIDWTPADPLLRNRLLAPFLGKAYGDALRDQEIRLLYDPKLRRLCAAYFDHRFPIMPAHYAEILLQGGETLAALAQLFAAASDRDKAIGEARHAAESANQQLAAVLDDAAVIPAFETALAAYSPESDEGRDRLHRLLDRQHYRLSWFRTAADEINWRRFFDVISLAGLRAEESAVFEATHAVIFRLFEEGLIDHLRIDHVDGLTNPRAYCRKLRARLQQLERRRPQSAPKGPAWIIVEKILAPTELLHDDWGIDGTSGYAFMSEVGALFHDPAGAAPLASLWTELSGRNSDFEQEERLARRRIPQELLAAELAGTAGAIHAIAQRDLVTRDFSVNAVRRVLLELLVHFPAYRTYADASGRPAADEPVMAAAMAGARETVRPAERGLLEWLDRWLGGEPPRRLPPGAPRRERLRAIARFQQLSAPTAAKSVEDTAFYRSGMLLSRNEVGANPAQFAISVDDFHAICVQRLQRFPATQLTIATHDHKRGADVRARIQVLAEIPADWRAAVSRWMDLNAPLKTVISGKAAPDRADEYMLYQMLIGAWPMGLRSEDADGLKNFAERLAAWQLKALREGKLQSGWIEPNLAYESACREFLNAILDPSQAAMFLTDVATFVERCGPAAAVIGLGQSLLTLTTPGVPDLYQGGEWWDFSMVDPDNRRPVDYAIREQALAAQSSPAELLHRWQDGIIKQNLIARVLAYRRLQPRLFSDGGYLPLKVSGRQSEHLIAFARIYRRSACISVATRLPCDLLGNATTPRIPPERWQDTVIELPPALQHKRWHDVLSDRSVQGAQQILVSNALNSMPLALLSLFAGK